MHSIGVIQGHSIKDGKTREIIRIGSINL